MKMSSGQETKLSILKSWQVKLAILSSIIIPTATATGAFFGLKVSRVEDKAELIQRVDKLELQSAKTFADKASLEVLDTRTRKMENDITEIKTILKTKL